MLLCVLGIGGREGFILRAEKKPEVQLERCGRQPGGRQTQALTEWRG